MEKEIRSSQQKSVSFNFKGFEKWGVPKPLIISKEYVLIAVNDKPFYFAAQADIDFKNIEDSKKKMILSVNKLIIQPSISIPDKETTLNKNFPSWVNYFQNINYIEVVDLIIDNFNLNSPSLERIILHKSKINSIDAFVNEISKYPNLKYLINDSTFTIDEYTILKDTLNNIQILNYKEYVDLVDSGNLSK